MSVNVLQSPQLDSRIEYARFSAACLVMVSHYLNLWAWPPGFWQLSTTGVDLFFVLSGFVFAPVLIHGLPSYRGHLIRRFFRMYPLFLLALIVYALLRGEWPGQTAAFWWHIAMLHTTQTWSLAAHYNLAFWSLPPEWMFYMTLPCIYAVIKTLGWWPTLFIAVILRGALAIGVPVVDEPWALSWLLVHLPGLLIEFLFGATVYRYVSPMKPNQQTRVIIYFLLCVSGFFVFYYYYVLRPLWQLQSVHPLVGNSVGVWAALCYALLLRLCLSQALPYGSNRYAKAGIFLGGLSYGIYLFHQASLLLVQGYFADQAIATQFFLSIFMTLVIAIALHYFWEAPWRNLGRRWAQGY